MECSGSSTRNMWMLSPRFAKSGDFEPIAVCWKDGRTFPIDEILEVGIS